MMIQSFSTKKRTLPVKIFFVTKWGKWWKILIITCTTLSTLSGAQLPQVSNIFPRGLCRIYLKCRKLWQITQGSFLRVDSSPSPPPPNSLPAKFLRETNFDEPDLSLSVNFQSCAPHPLFATTLPLSIFATFNHNLLESGCKLQFSNWKVMCVKKTTNGNNELQAYTVLCLNNRSSGYFNNFFLNTRIYAGIDA